MLGLELGKVVGDRVAPALVGEKLGMELGARLGNALRLGKALGCELGFTLPLGRELGDVEGIPDTDGAWEPSQIPRSVTAPSPGKNTHRLFTPSRLIGIL